MQVDYAPTEAEQKAEESAAAEVVPTAVFLPEPVIGSITEDVIAPLIPPLALGVLAFGLVALVIWAGQRMTNSATSQGMGYTRAMVREMATPGPDVVFRSRFRGSPANPSLGYAPMAAPPPISRSLVSGPFLGETARASARAALRPVRDLMSLVRRYDAQGLWDAPAAPAPTVRVAANNATGAVTTPTGGVAPAAFPSPNPGQFGAAAAASRAATFQGNGGGGPALTPTSGADSIEMVNKIHFRTEGLSTQVDMTTPVQQFPQPLQPGVQAVSQQLHDYLKDADLAATADQQSRATLHTQAAKRLQAAQATLDYMDGVINGTVDPDNMPTDPARITVTR